MYLLCCYEQGSGQTRACPQIHNSHCPGLDLDTWSIFNIVDFILSGRYTARPAKLKISWSEETASHCGSNRANSWQTVIWRIHRFACPVASSSVLAIWSLGGHSLCVIERESDQCSGHLECCPSGRRASGHRCPPTPPPPHFVRYCLSAIKRFRELKFNFLHLDESQFD